MSGGEIAGLIAAFAFVLLVGAVAIPLVKLGRTVDELTATVKDLRLQHVARTVTTVDETNELLSQVNGQLARIDAISANAQSVTTNAAALSSVVAAGLGRPVVKVSAFSYGVRQALVNRGSRTSTATGAGAEGRHGRRAGAV